MATIQGNNVIPPNIVLSNVGVQYIQKQDEFVVDKIFPVVPVELSTGSYVEFDRDMFGRADAKPRADATESEGGTWGQTYKTYNCLPVMSYHTNIGQQLRANYPSGLTLDKQATNFVARVLLQSRERKFVNSFCKTGIWRTDEDFKLNSGAQQFDNPNSTPVKKIKAIKEAVHLAGLREPNVMLLGRKAFDALTEHPDILDRLKYGGTNAKPADVTAEALAQIFGLEKVVVGKSVAITSPKGETIQAEYSFGKHAWIGYAAANAAIFEPSAGYIFDWVGYLRQQTPGMSDETNSLALAIYSFWIQSIKAQRIEGEYACDMKVVAPDMGYFLQDVVS